jgi:uncharacterized surface anchored protein
MAGGAIIHAAVTVVNAETNVKFASTTDSSGHFQVAELSPGDYSLVASADGFQQSAQDHVVVHAGDRISKNFVLTVGQHTEVVVIESTPGLQTGSAVMSCSACVGCASAPRGNHSAKAPSATRA